MNLRQYFIQTDSPTPAKFAEKCGVSYTTIKAVKRGMRVKNYDTAKKISDATNGKVTIQELCEEVSP